MESLQPGLWRWTAVHPDWKPSPTGSPGDWDRLVGCVLLEPAGPDEPLVLVDPQAPAAGPDGEAEAFWRDLDARVQAAGGRVVALVANSFHHRSAPAVLERYGSAAQIWAHEGAREHLEKVGCPVTRWYRDGERLPGGLVAREVTGLCPGEAALYLPRLHALLVADAFLGTEGGGLRVPPRSWALDPELYDRALRPSLRRLLDEPVELVVVSHGAPVTERAHEALEQALS